jgi:TPP-dependent pyruvate/acetoin dehydrogenase alpha subunit
VDKDPIKRLEAVLTEARGIDPDRLDDVRSQVRDEVRAAVERAEDDGYPDPSEAHLGVFAEPDADGWE